MTILEATKTTNGILAGSIVIFTHEEGNPIVLDINKVTSLTTAYLNPSEELLSSLTRVNRRLSKPVLEAVTRFAVEEAKDDTNLLLKGKRNKFVSTKNVVDAFTPNVGQSTPRVKESIRVVVSAIVQKHNKAVADEKEYQKSLKNTLGNTTALADLRSSF